MVFPQHLEQLLQGEAYLSGRVFFFVNALSRLTIERLSKICITNSKGLPATRRTMLGMTFEWHAPVRPSEKVGVRVAHRDNELPNLFPVPSTKKPAWWTSPRVA